MARPGCVVAVLTHSERLLHANTYPDDLHLPMEHGRLLLRCIMYPLRKIDNVIERLSEEEGATGRLYQETKGVDEHSELHARLALHATHRLNLEER